MAPVTVLDTGAGTRTDSSQPGRSIDEPYRPRGLGSRASRIRRPRPGAARTKKPMNAAKPKTSRLGALPPADAEELAAWSGGRSNGSGPRRRGVVPALAPGVGCDR